MTWGFLAAVLLATLPRFIYVGDAAAMRMGTMELIEHGHLEISGEFASRFGVRGQYFYQNDKTGAWYSKYGVLNSLLYLPPLLVERLFADRLLPLEALDSSAHLRRCLILSLYNIAISLLFAAYLFKAASRYAASPRAAGLYVILVCLGTFTWNYLRAQTVEIFQATLFTALFVHLMLWHDGLETSEDSLSRKHGHMASTLAGLMLLAKPLYVLVFPLLAVLFLGGRRKSAPNSPPWWSRLWLLAPMAMAGVLLAIANWQQFGAPWHTGYEQWEVKGAVHGRPAARFGGVCRESPQKRVSLFPPVRNRIGRLACVFQKAPV